jgi:hypothetical protein
MDNEKLFAIKLADEDKKIRDKCLAKIVLRRDIQVFHL